MAERSSPVAERGVEPAAPANPAATPAAAPPASAASASSIPAVRPKARTPKCRFDVLTWYDNHKYYIWSAKAGYALHKHKPTILKWTKMAPLRFWKNCLVLEFEGEGDVPRAAMAQMERLFEPLLPGVVISQDDEANSDDAVGSVVPIDLPDKVSAALDRVKSVPARVLRDIDLKLLEGVEWIAVGLCAEKIIAAFISREGDYSALLNWFCELLLLAGEDVVKEVVLDVTASAGVACPSNAEISRMTDVKALTDKLHNAFSFVAEQKHNRERKHNRDQESDDSDVDELLSRRVGPAAASESEASGPASLHLYAGKDQDPSVVKLALHLDALKDITKTLVLEIKNFKPA